MNRIKLLNYLHQVHVYLINSIWKHIYMTQNSELSWHNKAERVHRTKGRLYSQL